MVPTRKVLASTPCTLSDRCLNLFHSFRAIVTEVHIPLEKLATNEPSLAGRIQICRNRTRSLTRRPGMEPSAFILLWIMAINSVSAEGCGAQSCCWLKIPNDYCGITLPKIAVESPMDIAARFMVKNLQEVDEAKLSYIIDIK